MKSPPRLLPAKFGVGIDRSEDRYKSQFKLLNDQNDQSLDIKGNKREDRSKPFSVISGVRFNRA